ncbi:MAG: O-acetyl-ADP-ribose deacetylase [Candidatus Bathyarchaeia archaeon]
MIWTTGKIDLALGDITHQKVDAVVNAANRTLLGGGGVDGAIHRTAGPQLLEECRRLGGCPTGEARITKGYQLPAKYVIHTVGPVWRGGHQQEDELLRNCYVNSMKLAAENHVKTIAFPSISTGAYGFPIERAARIAVTTVAEYLDSLRVIEKAIFVCFSKNDYNVYQLELIKLKAS